MKLKKLTTEIIGPAHTPGMLPPFPKHIYGRTPCPREGCTGHTKWNDGPGHTYFFTCTSRGCDFDTRNPGVKSNFILPELKPKKKLKPVKIVPDPPELVEAFRAEVERKLEIMRVERAKFPPTLIKKKKKKGWAWVANPKFTEEMRSHMHKFGFTHEQVRLEILKGTGPFV